MQNVYVIDIETIPDPKFVDIFMETKIEKANSTLLIDEKKASGYKQQETIDKHMDAANEKYEKAIDPKKHRKAMSVSAHFSKVVCVGVKQVFGDMEKVFKLKGFAEWITNLNATKYAQDNVRDLGEDIAKGRGLVDGTENIIFITYNGTSFDFPVLINNLVREKLVDQHVLLDLKKCTKKYNRPGQVINHIDMSIDLNPYGTFIPLDSLTQIYLGAKKSTSGDEFFAKATEKELAEHCLDDIRLTSDLYKLFYK